MSSEVPQGRVLTPARVVLVDSGHSAYGNADPHTRHGTEIELPMFVGANQDCRQVNSTLAGTNEVTAALPLQTGCRTPEGDYRLYGEPMAKSGKAKAAA